MASGDDDVNVDLMRWEEDWSRRWLKPEDRTLIVGCGPGRDLVGTPLAVLQRASASLVSGGRLLISYIPARRRPSRLLALTRLAGRLTRSDWRLEDGDCIGPVTGRPPAVHFEHHFQRQEIEREARAAGLTVAGHRDAEEGMLVLTVGEGTGNG